MKFMNTFKLQAMKRTITFLLIILTFSVTRSAAQNANRERLNNYKIGFFTKKLNLTSEEAEKFWPVYNEYQDQKNSIQIERVKLIRDFKLNENNLSNAQLTEIGDKFVNSLAQESSLAVSFHKKLKEVLLPAKVITYYQAENQYKAQLLNELQNVRQQQRIRPGLR